MKCQGRGSEDGCAMSDVPWILAIVAERPDTKMLGNIKILPAEAGRRSLHGVVAREVQGVDARVGVLAEDAVLLDVESGLDALDNGVVRGL